MATKKSEVDAWTSNGKGIKSGPVSADRKAKIDKINKDMAAKKKSTAKKKK